MALKCHYKKKLLRRLLIEDENGVSLIDFLKSLNMKYSMDENEISSWLNSDSNDPGFQLITDDKISDHVLSEQMPDQEDEPEPEEGESNVCPVSNWQLI